MWKEKYSRALEKFWSKYLGILISYFQHKIIFSHTYEVWQKSTEIIYEIFIFSNNNGLQDVHYTLFWVFSKLSKWHLLRIFFSLGKRKSQELRSRWIMGLDNRRKTFWGQTFFGVEGSVTWGVVIMELVSHTDCPFLWALQRLLYKRIGWRFVLEE